MMRSRPATLTLAALVATCVLFACDGGDKGGGGDGGSSLRPDAMNDMDFDGIKDDVDNCPTVTNGSQGNEDGDRFGDACDPCPPIADDDPADTDGDGVADACDPLPIIIGDRMAFFEGFHQGLPLGWEGVGSWTAADDQLVGSASTPGYFALIATDRTRETITAQLTVTSVGGQASAVGLVDNKLGDSPSAIACVITGAGELAVFDTEDVAGAETTAYELAAGASYLMRLRRDNSTYTCTATRGSQTATVTKTIQRYNSPYLSGLTLTDAAIRVDWLMIVESL